MAETIPIIFVIDDDPSVRNALGRLLRSTGYAVKTFGSSEEFLQNIPDGLGPACLILDVKMPGLNGLELQN